MATMIVEQCGCGARIEFEKRPRSTYAEQDRSDQEFLSQFRAEHVCSLRAVVGETSTPLRTPCV